MSWSDKDINRSWLEMERLLDKELPISTIDSKSPSNLKRGLVVLISFLCGLMTMFFVQQYTELNQTEKQTNLENSKSTVQAFLPIDTYEKPSFIAQVVDFSKQKLKVANQVFVSQIKEITNPSEHSINKGVNDISKEIAGTAVDNHGLDIESKLIDQQIQYEKTYVDYLTNIESIKPSPLIADAPVEILLAAVPFLKNRFSQLFVDINTTSNFTLNSQIFRPAVGLETKLSPNTFLVKGINYSFGFQKDEYVDLSNVNKNRAPVNPFEEGNNKPDEVPVSHELQYHTSHGVGLFTGVRYQFHRRMSMESLMGLDYLLRVSSYDAANILKTNVREFSTWNGELNNWQLYSKISTNYHITPSFIMGLTLDYQFQPLFKTQTEIIRDFSMTDAVSFGLRSRMIF